MSFRGTPPASARERLDRYAAGRGDVLARIAVAGEDNLQVVGLWLVGSLGRGTGDAWSDLDLVIVPTDQALSVVAADPVQALGVGADVLFLLRRPVNGSVGGTYMGICYQVENLPLWLDCYVWPLRTAQIPADGRPLVERPEHSIPQAAEEFAALLDRHRAPAAGAGESDRDRQRFRLLATLVASKSLARGDRSGVAGMLRWVDLPAVDVTRAASVVSGLRHLLATVTDPELAKAVQATTGLVDLAESFTRQAP
ncbi:nucleotidyltransferase domain-containing protein [Actinomadura miaoliensis]|uniref:Polymerase nucleotidyl transferase domain-containing protein n=1 Tax=Actinomadura miaoliensis TaxID=430685 RepID=A0ABP7VZA5_9ACTN